MKPLSEEEQKKILGENITFYISQCGKNQKDVAIDLDVNPPTFNTWCTGSALPSVTAIQRIAEYFHIYVADLIDKRTDNGYVKHYCLNEEAEKTAQEMYDKDGVLFDIYNSSDKKRLVDYANKLKELRDMEKGDM